MKKSFLAKLKKVISPLMIVFGVFIIFNNVFRFSYKLIKESQGGILPKLPSSSFDVVGVAYYYQDVQIYCITFGAVLLTIGLLLMNQKNSKK